MNRSSLRSYLRSLLNEPSAGFWSDDTLNTYLNVAYHKLRGHISTYNEDYFTKIVTFTTTAGSGVYALPSDFSALRRLEIYDPNDAGNVQVMFQKSFPDIERNGPYPFTSTDRPGNYIIIAQNLHLYPTPDSAYNMRMFYDYDAPDMTSETSTPLGIPDEFQDMVALWAAVQATMQAQDDPSSFMAIYNIREIDIISALTGRSGDQPQFVRGYFEGDGLTRW